MLGQAENTLLIRKTSKIIPLKPRSRRRIGYLIRSQFREETNKGKISTVEHLQP